MGHSELDAQIMRKIDWGDILVDLLPGGVGIYELGEREITTLYANEGIARLLEGYSEEDVREISRHADRLIYEKDMPILVEEVRLAEKEGRPVDCNVRYHRSPNTVGWLWIRGEQIKKRDDNRTIFFALLIDANRQKALEQDLLIQQERYRILEDTSSEILFEINPFKDEMAYSMKELDGTLSRKVIEHYLESLHNDSRVHPDFLEEYIALVDSAMCQPTSGKLEYLSKISGRGYEWHRLTYKSVADSSGRVMRVFGRTKCIHDEVLKQQVLHSQSDIDQMTNLYHNNFLVTQIKEKMKASAFDSKHTLILVGIDQFNKIVEQNGHSCGDIVIQKVSALFQQTVERLSVFGRKGNEKFMAYVEDEDDDMIDEKMKEFLSMFLLPENQVADISIKCSVGVATIVGPTEYEEIYEKADEALYLAKITKGTDYIRVS